MTQHNPRVYVLVGALKQAREDRGMTQKTLAEESGVSVALIGLIETGERQPRYGNAIAIADALKRPIDSFALVLTDETTARLRHVIGEPVAA